MAFIAAKQYISIEPLKPVLFDSLKCCFIRCCEQMSTFLKLKYVYRYFQKSCGQILRKIKDKINNEQSVLIEGKLPPTINNITR